MGGKKMTADIFQLALLRMCDSFLLSSLPQSCIFLFPSWACVSPTRCVSPTPEVLRKVEITLNFDSSFLQMHRQRRKVRLIQTVNHPLKFWDTWVKAILQRSTVKQTRVSGSLCTVKWFLICVGMEHLLDSLAVQLVRTSLFQVVLFLRTSQ